MAAESSVTHRRRYRGSVRPADVLELLLLDPDNPRSIAFSLARLRFHLSQLAGSTGSTRPERLLEHLEDALEAADIAALTAHRRRSTARTSRRSSPRRMTQLAPPRRRDRASCTSRAARCRSRSRRSRSPRSRGCRREVPRLAHHDLLVRRRRHDSLGLAALPCRACCRGSRWRPATVVGRPAAGDITDDIDCYGNIVSYFQVTEPHMRLVDRRAQRGRRSFRPSTTPTPCSSRGSARGRS